MFVHYALRALLAGAVIGGILLALVPAIAWVEQRLEDKDNQ